MTGSQILILVALTVFAVYRQTARTEVVGRTRFKLAAIYAAVGLLAGGFYLPPDSRSWWVLALSLAASAIVGVLRGRLTRLYREPNGRLFSQGTPVTIGLFLLLIAGKFAWGAWEYSRNAHPHGGFGEILLMIAAMVAMQAQIVWRRAQALHGSQAAPEPTGSPG
ncbi:MAG TPA: hypothetical protein VEA17_04200 [Bordetella sp.]|nr:hypothetical protein [Bordetella sp.]